MRRYREQTEQKGEKSHRGSSVPTWQAKGNSFLDPELLTSVPYLPRASKKEDFQRYQKRSHPTSLACASNSPLASNYPQLCLRAHWLGSQHWFLS